MGVYTNFEMAIIQSVLAAVVPAQPVVPTIVQEIPAAASARSGFAGQARVATAVGEMAIEALRVGDDVRTFSGKSVRVLKIDKIILGDADADPVRISANAFGPSRPAHEITVLSAQEIGLDAHVATRFKAASDFGSQTMVNRVKAAGKTFYQVHCGETITVRVEGVWVRIKA